MWDDVVTVVVVVVVVVWNVTVAPRPGVGGLAFSNSRVFPTLFFGGTCGRGRYR